MSTSNSPMNDLTLKQRQLAAIADGIRRDTHLSTLEVMKHLAISRAVLESYPIEILRPWDATPNSRRARRRYSPADVKVAPVLIRRWTEAIALGKGEEFLRERREAIREQEDEIISQAMELRAA